MIWRIALILAMVTTTLRAAPPDAPASPPVLDGVGIDQKLGTRLPLETIVRTESGQSIPLSTLFHGRPVVLTFVYYQCPMLCSLTLNQLTRSLTALSESAGDQFDIVTLSFDPREKPELAAAKKENYLRSYRRPTAAEGWHFLTADAQSIQSLTKAAGFRYRWDPTQQLFVHAAAVIVLTPDGTISRYFLGVDFPPTELRQAIRDADRAVVGPAAQPVYFYCFKYDAKTGRYGLMIDRATKALGALVVASLVGLIVGLHFVSVRRSRRAAAAQHTVEGNAAR